MDFETHLKKYLKDEDIKALLMALIEKDYHAAILNTSKMADETFLKLYPHVKKHPIVPHAYLYDKNEYPLGKSLEHELGAFYLQEPSAMLPAYFLNAKENDKVLDLCSAPGGKTIQSALLMHNKGVIIANDIDKSRCQAILENVERLGLTNVVITNNDFASIYQEYLDYFDKIILDAPCSGSGMFRKLETMKDDWSINKVYKYAAIQKELILMAYKMLSKGGEMVYSTCSFSYEENEEVIDYLLKNSDAQIVDIPAESSLYKDKKLPYGVHTFPHLFKGEGHYICLINKPGEKKIKKDKKENKKSTYAFLKDYKIVNKYGNYIFAINDEIKTKKLNIVRFGLKIGQNIKNNEIKYDYHYARSLSTFANIYPLTKEELISILKGETINTKINKGEYLLTYNNLNVCIAKSDGRILKNNYPKARRKDFSKLY